MCTYCKLTCEYIHAYVLCIYTCIHICIHACTYKTTLRVIRRLWGGGGTRGTSHRLSQQDHINITSASHLQQINTASQHLPTVSHHTSNQHLDNPQLCRIDITSVSHQYRINSKTMSRHFHKYISSQSNLSCQQLTTLSHRHHINIPSTFK